MALGACSQDFFGQFKGLFEEFSAKRGGLATPPPSGSASASQIPNISMMIPNGLTFSSLNLSSSSTTSRDSNSRLEVDEDDLKWVTNTEKYIFIKRVV